MSRIVRTKHILTDVTNVVPTEVEVLEPMTITAKHCNQRGKAGGTSVATNAHSSETFAFKSRFGHAVR